MGGASCRTQGITDNGLHNGAVFDSQIFVQDVQAISQIGTVRHKTLSTAAVEVHKEPEQEILDHASRVAGHPAFGGPDLVDEGNIVAGVREGEKVGEAEDEHTNDLSWVRHSITPLC